MTAGRVFYPLDPIGVGEAIEVMIRVSDNSSAWILRDLVGWALIDADMANSGLRDTTVDRRWLTTSPDNMAILFQMMALAQAATPAANRDMAHVLAHQTVRDRLPALLPSDTRAATKTPDSLRATHAVGIAYSPTASHVIAILSDRRRESEPIARFSPAVCNNFQTYDGK